MGERSESHCKTSSSVTFAMPRASLPRAWQVLSRVIANRRTWTRKMPAAVTSTPKTLVSLVGGKLCGPQPRVCCTMVNSGCTAKVSRVYGTENGLLICRAEPTSRQKAEVSTIGNMVMVTLMACIRFSNPAKSEEAWPPSFDLQGRRQRPRPLFIPEARASLQQWSFGSRSRLPRL